MDSATYCYSYVTYMNNKIDFTFDNRIIIYKLSELAFQENNTQIEYEHNSNRWKRRKVS